MPPAATAATQPEIGASCDVVLTMLPNSPQVKQVMLGEDGVAAHMRTRYHLYRHELHQPGGQQGDRRRIGGKEQSTCWRPPPFSGGEPKAIDGTLSFMVGGKQEVFDRFKPLLETMGSSVVRCGEVGARQHHQAGKQIIVACNIQALAEALTLAQKAGVDPELVFEAIKRRAWRGSTVMNAKAPHDDGRR